MLFISPILQAFATFFKIINLVKRQRKSDAASWGRNGTKHLFASPIPALYLKVLFSYTYWAVFIIASTCFYKLLLLVRQCAVLLWWDSTLNKSVNQGVERKMVVTMTIGGGNGVANKQRKGNVSIKVFCHRKQRHEGTSWCRKEYIMLTTTSGLYINGLYYSSVHFSLHLFWK